MAKLLTDFVDRCMVAAGPRHSHPIVESMDIETHAYH
jgi:hypothetical protein